MKKEQLNTSIYSILKARFLYYYGMYSNLMKTSKRLLLILNILKYLYQVAVFASLVFSGGLIFALTFTPDLYSILDFIINMKDNILIRLSNFIWKFVSQNRLNNLSVSGNDSSLAHKNVTDIENISRSSYNSLATHDLNTNKGVNLFGYDIPYTKEQIFIGVILTLTLGALCYYSFDVFSTDGGNPPSGGNSSSADIAAAANAAVNNANGHLNNAASMGSNSNYNSPSPSIETLRSELDFFFPNPEPTPNSPSLTAGSLTPTSINPSANT